MFTPMGPGVDSDTAIMVVRSASVNQPVVAPIFCRKGMVAMPPPTANKPVLKNS